MTKSSSSIHKFPRTFRSLSKGQLLLGFFLLLLSILSTGKLLFLGLGIDEEYAVAMSYRILTGDRMWMEMWEPHQTSGFVGAFFIYFFQKATAGNLDYLVLYLRLCGVLIHGGISLFLFFTLRRFYDGTLAFVATLLFFNTLPKWIQSPEFANMLVWWSVLAYLCFLRYYLSEVPKGIYLVGAGVAFCALVLVYPSCILAAPVLLLAILRLHRRSFLHESFLLWGTCLLIALVYLGYFLLHMSLEDFVFGLKQMMRDGSHSAGALSRLSTYLGEIVHLAPHACLSALPALVLCLSIRRFRNWQSFWALLLLCSLLEQEIVWLLPSLYMQTPLIYFYILYMCGVFHLLVRARADQGPSSPSVGVQAWFGLAFGGGVWLSSLVITNTNISATGSYLMCGLIASLVLIRSSRVSPGDCPKDSSRHPSSFLYGAALVLLLAVTLFSKGWLVYENDGRKADITFVKQKALYGPAKGIYCRYTDGHEYNLCAQLTEEYIQPGDRVLYVGVHPLRYLLADVSISNYSTISTPTFDSRLMTYWSIYPDKYPNVLVVDSGNQFPEALKLLPLGKLTSVERNGIILYR